MTFQKFRVVEQAEATGEVAFDQTRSFPAGWGSFGTALKFSIWKSENGNHCSPVVVFSTRIAPRLPKELRKDLIAFARKTAKEHRQLLASDPILSKRARPIPDSSAPTEAKAPWPFWNPERDNRDSVASEIQTPVPE